MARNDICIGAKCLGYVDGDKAYANWRGGGHVATYFANMDRTDYMGNIGGSYRGNCLQAAVFASYYKSQDVEREAKKWQEDIHKAQDDKRKAAEDLAKKIKDEKAYKSKMKELEKKYSSNSKSNSKATTFEKIKMTILLIVIILSFIYPYSFGVGLFWYCVIKFFIHLHKSNN